MKFQEADVRSGFAQDEFFPVFQPLVELRTGQLVGFEALARWRNEKLGLVSPDDFIPAVEECGLIDRLTTVILEKAFTLRALKESALSLSVNISPGQLLGPNTAERLMSTAAEAGFPLNRLIIEITESALLDDLERAQAVALELKALQCKLALDDFGTGYSSLQHLHTLPFDELKVDRSFVSSMTEKRESRKIVAAVVGLGQSLGLATVAEGVESQEQASMLLRMGCDLVQGWLYGKPVGAAELPTVISEMQRNAIVPMPAPMNEDSTLSFEALPAQRLAQLQAVYDGAPVGLCFLDRKLRYVSLNRRLAQMNGVPLAEHLGRTVAEVIPHVFPRVESFIRRAMQGEPISGVEVQKPPPDGTSEGQTLMISYQPARDEAGEVLGVSVAIMDISESKRTEAALRESEDHFRSMVKLHPHVPWVLNTKGEVIEASPRWEDYTGQPLAEALGNGWLKALHPDDVEPTKEAIRISLETGDPIDIEYRVKNPCGEWLWMRSRGAPRFGPTGKIICVYGVVEEVHGQKQESKDLLECQAKLGAALDAVPLGVVLADAADCTIVKINPAARQILGADVVLGETLTDYTRQSVTYPDGRPLKPDEYPIARALLHGETVHAVEILYTRRDGARLRLSASSKPIFADSELIGAVLVLCDLDTAP